MVFFLILPLFCAIRDGIEFKVNNLYAKILWCAIFLILVSVIKDYLVMGEGYFFRLLFPRWRRIFYPGYMVDFRFH